MSEIENIKKAAFIKSAELNENDIELIKRFSLLNEIDTSKIFTFKVALCNNEIDRDFECFSKNSLEQLAVLFLGKTGIKDHSMKSNDQVARLYKTEVVESEDLTSYGEKQAELIGYAYMVRTKENASLIEEIELGIKKEVSVSCAIGSPICSVCGKDLRKDRCEHRPGMEYDGKMCFVMLENPKDAYEFSFVAVPAQIGAGTKKEFAVREPYPTAVEKEKSKKTIKSTIERAFLFKEEN